ncbi:MAG TPA: alpha-1,4-glucan--maltose-1-phosphate maltosyltransferase [Terriglobia bacterium]|nr:alpha-1,4-glucan--maltose-1-phosphate maltosyltransferase [Terriglobia bacterium]
MLYHAVSPACIGEDHRWEKSRLAEAAGRVAIESVTPEVDSGRFPIKRVPGETVIVECDAFADGHDVVRCLLLYRREQDTAWKESVMRPRGNDRWRGEFRVEELGRYAYTVEAWIDAFETWRGNLVKRIDAGQDTRVDILIGVALIQSAADRASEPDRELLARWAGDLSAAAVDTVAQSLALNEEFASILRRYPDRASATRYPGEFRVRVDRRKARFSAWYEMFPRSCASSADKHGTFADCEARLPYVAAMGFDVLYLPPIHPIGRTHRKGRNNTVEAGPEDVGSPWAIGGEAGGHTAIHPSLGTLADFNRFVSAAGRHGLEVAMDIAFQCSPDHPWVREHPEWFRRRPDGTIQYAENPPKKYQDIFPLDFDTPAWRELWEALREVIRFWAEQGIRIFRVDNPHTKAFPFWEWVIERIQSEYPDTIFLSEAFTRPKVKHRLAKLGFSQSYTYFTWRNTAAELTAYMRELISPGIREYLRPNLWPNTPDILPEYLQIGGRAGFIIRLILAATLGSNYGIYGPAFELLENTPGVPGGEEYFASEKYEIRQWDLDSSVSLKNLIARVNRARRENPALQHDWRLHFHEVDNPEILCYSKTNPDCSNVIVVVVSLDFQHVRSGWVRLDLDKLGLSESSSFQAHDLVGDGRFLWQGSRNYVELDPQGVPAHILRVRRKVRSEEDFDYYL